MNIDQAYVSFEEQMAILEENDSRGERAGRIRADADTLISNIESIRSETVGAFGLVESLEALQAELGEVRGQLDDALAPAIDDQLFYTITGRRDLSEPPAPRSEHFSEEELIRYRRLAEMQADANIATELLANAFTLSDDSLIEPLRERFEATTSRLDRNLAALEGSPFHDEAVPIFARLFDLGLGEESVFDLFAQELRIASRQEELLAHNRVLSVELVDEVDGLVSAAQASAQEATRASAQAILTGRTLLLGISGAEYHWRAPDHLALRRQDPAAASRAAVGLDAPHGPAEIWRPGSRSRGGTRSQIWPPPWRCSGVTPWRCSA